MKKTTQLQELFHRGKVFVIAGGGCALHAKIAELNASDREVIILRYWHGLTHQEIGERLAR